jgi:hypothetical protein
VDLEKVMLQADVLVVLSRLRIVVLLYQVVYRVSAVFQEAMYV